MSSVGRFIRQVDNSNHFLSAATVAAAPATYAFELVPDASNIVGNYAPGYMAAASAALILAVQQAVNAANGSSAANLVLRDMGKTVRAPVASSSGAIGFFRQVQLLNPLVGAAGVLGAPATPDAYTNYLTFYVPVVINGVCAAGTGAAIGALHPVNGQM
jgi:hypothetical protein